MSRQHRGWGEGNPVSCASHAQCNVKHAGAFKGMQLHLGPYFLSFIRHIFWGTPLFSSLRVMSFQVFIVFQETETKKKTCMCCSSRIEMKTWELPSEIQWLDQIKPSLLKGVEVDKVASNKVGLVSCSRSSGCPFMQGGKKATCQNRTCCNVLRSPTHQWQIRRSKQWPSGVEGLWMGSERGTERLQRGWLSRRWRK